MIMTAKAFWFGEDPNRGGTSELRSKLGVNGYSELVLQLLYPFA
jgi:hypothetical protein